MSGGTTSCDGACQAPVAHAGPKLKRGLGGPVGWTALICQEAARDTQLCGTQSLSLRTSVRCSYQHSTIVVKQPSG